MLCPTTFTALSLEAQLAVICRQGTFLLTRYEAKETINLYALDAFFVEVYCNPVIHGVRAFVGTRALEAYLRCIALPF
jgi:hypothetical protein